MRKAQREMDMEPLKCKTNLIFFQNEWICLMAHHTAEKSLKSMIFLTEGSIDFNHQLSALTSRLTNSANGSQLSKLTSLRTLTSRMESIGGNSNKILLQ